MRKYMYVYCIDICIIFMTCFAAFNGHGFDSIAMPPALYNFCKHFQVNMEEKNLNKCMK